MYLSGHWLPTTAIGMGGIRKANERVQLALSVLIPLLE